ncbi:MAG: serine/threonine-protein kinase, partial [Opitutales bacterium]
MGSDDDTILDGSARNAGRAPSLAPGAKLGDYVLERQLGAGAMGEVYLARQMRLDQLCAVKILPAELSASQDFERRFASEGRALARLDHQNIVRVLNAGEDAGRHFLAMEYVEGGSLEERLASAGGVLPVAEARQALSEMLSALAYAHGKNVVHRDLKPANILRTAGGQYKISDFGLALVAGEDYVQSLVQRSVVASRLATDADDDATILAPASRASASDASALVGTIDYMSPEVRTGRPADARSDIFAIGVMAYQLLTGRKPLGMARAPSSVAKGVSKDWDAWVARCMEFDPQERFQSAEAALKALPAAAAEARRRPSRLIVALGGILFLFLLIKSSSFGLMETIPVLALLPLLVSYAAGWKRVTRIYLVLLASVVVLALFMEFSGILSSRRESAEQAREEMMIAYANNVLAQAESEFQSGDLEGAERDYNDVVSMVDSSDEQKEQARTALDAVRKASLAPGGIIVKSEPSGALIFLQDGHSATTPALVKDLRPGSYDMEISLEGYDTLAAKVEVEPGEYAELPVFALERSFGALVISSNPAEASWEIVDMPEDSQPEPMSGLTPAVLKQLPTGEYLIEFNM